MHITSTLKRIVPYLPPVGGATTNTRAHPIATAASIALMVGLYLAGLISQMPWPVTLTIVLLLVAWVVYIAGWWHSRVQFYESREEMRRGHSLLDELNSAKTEVWASWHTAASVGASGGLGRDKAASKITRLVLIDPDVTGYLAMHANWYEGYRANELAAFIYSGTRRLYGEGVEAIRWFNGPPLGLTIVDPHGENGKIRVEPWAPWLEADFQPNFVIKRKEHPLLFSKLVKAFEDLWQNSKTAEKKINP